MTAKIVAWSLNNRFLVVVFSILWVAAGIEHMMRLPIDAVPDVTNVQVQVLTKAPALAPLEVERLITFPVEAAMAGLPDIEEVRSVSKFGLSVVTIVFEEGTDIFLARQLVQERMVEARENIAPGYGSPEMGPIATGLGEIYQFEVRGEPMCVPDKVDDDNCISPMELRTTLDWFVAYQLKSVPGVVEINTFGGQLKTYEVSPDPAALQAHSLALPTLIEALEKNNRNVGGAYLVRNREQVVIRGEGLITRLQDIENIVVDTSDDGMPLFVRDVANVHFAPMVRQGVVTRDGRGEAVVGIVMMLMGENSRVVAAGVKEKIESIKGSLPKGMSIETFYDRTDLVKRTISTVETNLLEGGLLVIVVLLLMLGSLRGGLIVAVAIPLSMLFAFIGMVRADVSGNLMSLGAIDFGLIVDGSVVMVENVFRLMSDKNSKDKTPFQIVHEATVEVARPVSFAVGIIMIVYVPILTLTGVEGKMFSPMAITVIFALIGSLILALTLVPVLASFFLNEAPRNHETWLVRFFRKRYEPMLNRVLKHRLMTVVIAGVLFIFGVLAASTRGAEFIPNLDEGAIALQVWRLPSVSIDEAAQQSSNLERVLLEAFSKEVSTVISKTGRPEIATDPMGVEMSDVFVMLNSPDKWRYETKAELISEMEKTLSENVPGVAFGFSQPIQLRVSELISGVRSDVAIQVYGPDLNELNRIGKEISRVVAKIKGADDVKVEQVSGLPIMTAKLDRDAIARHGVNGDEVLTTIEALGGRKVGVVLEGERRFSLQVRFSNKVRNSEENIARIPIAGKNGRIVPLGELVTFDTEPSAAQVSRSRIQRRISVELNVRDRDVASVVKDAQKAIASKVNMPAGYTLEWAGQFENLERASKRLMLVVPLALLLIFVLLFSSFNAVRPALLIFLNVPFAAIGGIFALTLRDLPFSISAGVGFIALFGIAVMNGVVLVTYIRKLEDEGITTIDAAKEGALVRMRPVLMTALVAALGFIPMAFASGSGAEVQRPLATVVIGGLVSATLLTLFVLPTLYTWTAKAMVHEN